MFNVQGQTITKDQECTGTDIPLQRIRNVHGQIISQGRNVQGQQTHTVTFGLLELLLRS